MKHLFNRNGDQWLRIAPDVINSQPGLTYGNDNMRPYWKTHGSGRERLMIEKEVNGSFLVRMINEVEEGKGRKETWLHLDKETAAQIGAFLQGGKQHERR
jgi:hypothetical protein